MLLLKLSWVGGLLLAGAGLWCGWETAALWRRRRCCLEETARFLQQILDAVQDRRLPTGEILAELQRSGYVYLPLADCTVLQTLSPPVLLTREQAAQLRRCLSNLGHQTARPQCEELRRAVAYFTACAAVLRQKEQTAAAICPRVGLCAGAMAALALL